MLKLEGVWIFGIIFGKYSWKYNLSPETKWPKLNTNFWEVLSILLKIFSLISHLHSDVSVSTQFVVFLENSYLKFSISSIEVLDLTE